MDEAGRTEEVGVFFKEEERCILLSLRLGKEGMAGGYEKLLWS
jgi:hypothetical protein